jgi:hypothetical protein
MRADRCAERRPLTSAVGAYITAEGRPNLSWLMTEAHRIARAEIEREADCARRFGWKPLGRPYRWYFAGALSRLWQAVPSAQAVWRTAKAEAERQARSEALRQQLRASLELLAA